MAVLPLVALAFTSIAVISSFGTATAKPPNSNFYGMVNWGNIWRKCQALRKKDFLQILPGMFYTKPQLSEMLWAAGQHLSGKRGPAQGRKKRTVSDVCAVGELEIQSQYCTTCMNVNFNYTVITVSSATPRYLVYFYDFYYNQFYHQFVPEANCQYAEDDGCGDCHIQQIPVTVLVTDTPPHYLYGHSIYYIAYYFNVWFDVIWTSAYCKCQAPKLS